MGEAAGGGKMKNLGGGQETETAVAEEGEGSAWESGWRLSEAISAQAFNAVVQWLS